MTFHTTIVYKNGPDTRFDLDYYLKTHMPLAAALFFKHGLKSWNVVEYAPGGDGAKPEFIIGLTLVWENAEQLTAALTAPDAEPVFADVPNFTNGNPTLLSGSVVGSS